MNVIWLMSSLFIFFYKTKPKIMIAQQPKHPFFSLYLKSWIRLVVVFNYLMVMKNTKNQICLSQLQRATE